jgi:hypothetical protein
LTVAQRNGKVTGHHIVFYEVAFHLFGLVAQGQDETVMAIGRKDTHDMPDNRLAAHLHQLFFGDSLPAHSGPLPAA